MSGGKKDEVLAPVSADDAEFAGLGDRVEADAQKEEAAGRKAAGEALAEAGPDAQPDGGKAAQADPEPPVEASQKQSPRERAVASMLRKAGRSAIPPIEELLKNREGTQVAIKDIAIFIGEPDGEILQEQAALVPVRNRCNLSAEVHEPRVLAVGADILKAGSMFTPIHVALIQPDVLECVSGRHRLVVLSLLYGPEAQVPVHLENMTLNEARDATIVANDSRPIKALEKAEHAILRAVDGDVDAEQDDLYTKGVTSKASAREYCVFSVINRGRPAKLGFKVSLGSSRKGGGLTTLSNIKNFWACSLAWDSEKTRKDFDAELRDSIRFLNALVAEFEKNKKFNSMHQMSSMAMKAIGKYCRNYADISKKPVIDSVANIAKALVTAGEIGRWKSEKIYKLLLEKV
jgi:hypothetical protein